MVRLILIGVLWLIFQSDLGLTADIALVSKKGDKNTEISLSGDIVKGDTQKFSTLLKSIGNPSSHSENVPGGRVLVYLNSLGGNFAEGLALAKFFSDKVLSTRVRSNAECDSACAIAFLGGAEALPEDSSGTDRAVEIGGKLGFHAPFLEVADGNYDQAVVDSAYRVAISDIAGFLRLINSLNFSTDVLPEIFDVGPNSMKYLHAVDDFARFNVGISPALNAPNFTRSMVENACHNGWAWNASKIPGEGIKALTPSGHFENRNFAIVKTKSKYFSLDPVPVARVVLLTAEGGEGTTAYCLYDIVKVDGALKSSCRGFVWADDIEGAKKRALQLEAGEADGMDEKCDWIDSGVGGYNVVPGTTKIENAQKVMTDLLAKESPILP